MRLHAQLIQRRCNQPGYCEASLWLQCVRHENPIVLDLIGNGTILQYKIQDGTTVVGPIVQSQYNGCGIGRYECGWQRNAWCLALCAHMQRGARRRCAHFIAGRQVHLICAAAHQILQFMIGNVPRQRLLLLMANGALVVDGVIGDWRITIRTDFPMHVNAAGCGAGHIQHRRARRHLYNQIVCEQIGTDAVVHLATVVARIDHLQIGQHKVAGVEELHVVRSAVTQHGIAAIPFAPWIPHRHAGQCDGRPPRLHHRTAKGYDACKHAICGDRRCDTRTFALAHTRRRAHPKLVFDVRLQIFRLIAKRLRTHRFLLMVQFLAAIHNARVEIVFGDETIWLSGRHP